MCVCVCVCVCVVFPTWASNSWTPAGCVRIQLNSDTTYPEMESEYSIPQACTSLQTPVKNPDFTCIFDQLAISRRFHDFLSLSSVNSLKGSQNSGKPIYSLGYGFITKDVEKIQIHNHMQRCMGVRVYGESTWASMFSPGPLTTPYPHMEALGTHSFGVLWSFLYIVMID